MRAHTTALLCVPGCPQAGNERFETRLAMIQVLSRVIGVHKLLVLNFYAFLQKYIASHQRDVTVRVYRHVCTMAKSFAGSAGPCW
eukprot:361687-Chlamydomonas_euryale.AAC.6